MTISPFESPLLGELLGDETVARLLSPQIELEQVRAFEIALARALGEEEVIPSATAGAIVERLTMFEPDIGAVRRATARDGVIGVELIRQMRQWVGAPSDRYVHFGATSQDIVDTALVMRLKPVLAELGSRLDHLVELLQSLALTHGTRLLMGRTRMRDAVPITVADKIRTWRAPLLRHAARLDELMPRLLVLQFGGAVGTLDKLGDRGPAVAARVAADLGLRTAAAWHSQRDNIVELADWLSLLSGSLGKIGADIALMGQDSIGEIVLAGGGSSSAMPHKDNPVGAEVLVALARFNATLVGGMHGALVHEQERSGAAWTLEWMILPQMVLAAAASLRTASTLLHRITSIGKEP